MIVFFDTETTGLPLTGSRWDANYSSFPYVVQLSWKRSDRDDVNDYIINNNVNIPASAYNIHGITTEIASQSNFNFIDVAKKFLSDCRDAKYVVGHNIYFDTSIIKANILRFEPGLINVACIYLDKSKRIDTMMKTIKFCGLKKWPKLSELNYVLFKENFNAHNAKDDVLACERCFNRLVELRVI